MLLTCWATCYNLLSCCMLWVLHSAHAGAFRSHSLCSACPSTVLVTSQTCRCWLGTLCSVACKATPKLILEGFCSSGCMHMSVVSRLVWKQQVQAVEPRLTQQICKPRKHPSRQRCQRECLNCLPVPCQCHAMPGSFPPSQLLLYSYCTLFTHAICERTAFTQQTGHFATS